MAKKGGTKRGAGRRATTKRRTGTRDDTYVVPTPLGEMRIPGRGLRGKDRRALVIALVLIAAAGVGLVGMATAAPHVPVWVDAIERSVNAIIALLLNVAVTAVVVAGAIGAVVLLFRKPRREQWS